MEVVCAPHFLKSILEINIEKKNKNTNYLICIF